MESLNQIVNEQQRRKRARNSLIEFTHAIEVPGRPLSPDPDAWLFSPIETAVAPHHALLLRTADQVINTPQGRAMILMPPGSAKSTYCSSVLPAYAMGRRPGFRMMVTSYSSELARRHSRRARSIANSLDYFRIFDTRVSADAFAADDWALTNGSEYMAAGIQAGLTGNRADGIVIDDPVKGRDEANSEAIRTATRDAYEDDVKTRLTPGGWIILIQTRWHQDDLAGSILPADWAGESGLIRCRDGLDWNVLCVPARADRHDDPLGRRSCRRQRRNGRRFPAGAIAREGPCALRAAAHHTVSSPAKAGDPVLREQASAAPRSNMANAVITSPHGVIARESGRPSNQQTGQGHVDSTIENAVVTGCRLRGPIARCAMGTLAGNDTSDRARPRPTQTIIQPRRSHHVEEALGQGQRLAHDPRRRPDRPPRDSRCIRRDRPAPAGRRVGARR